MSTRTDDLVAEQAVPKPARTPSPGPAVAPDFVAQAASVHGNATVARLVASAAHATDCACGSCASGGPRVARAPAHEQGCGCSTCGTAQLLARTVAARSHEEGCGCGGCAGGGDTLTLARSSAHDEGCGCGTCTSAVLARSAAGDPAERLSGAQTASIVREGVSGGGQPLDAGLRTDMENRFGQDFSSVLVHTDLKASQSASAVMARAYTVGPDIVFGAGAYQPHSSEGRDLIAHELAHVKQQGVARQSHDSLEITRPGDATERDAETDAAGALTGAPGPQAPVVGRAVLARFQQGTTEVLKKDHRRNIVKQLKRGKDGQIEGIGHAVQTEQTLDAMENPAENDKLSDDEIRKGRQGNWMRDLSQAITPLTQKAVHQIIPILNVLSIKEFGRPFDTEAFGTYDPVEHMDNVAGLRGDDVIQQYDPNDPDGARKALENPSNFDDPFRKGEMKTQGSGDEGYAKADKRYEAAIEKEKERYRAMGKEYKVALDTGGEESKAFDVDQSGLQGYMYATKEHLKGKMHQAARAGRHERRGEGNAPVQGNFGGHSGPVEFASGIHSLQDYYAHTNFVEIAINILLQEPGGIQVAGGKGGHSKNCPEHDPKACGDEHSHQNAHDPESCGDTSHPHIQDEGDPGHTEANCANPNHAHEQEKIDQELETLRADTHGLLDTRVYDTDETGARTKQNTWITDASGKKRQVMSTGSFNLTDTAASILEEVLDKIREMNPFSNAKEPAEVTMAALDWLDSPGVNQEGSYNEFGKKWHPRVQEARQTLKAAAPVVTGIVDTAGDIGGSIVRGAGELASGALGFMNQVNSFFGGDEDYFDDAKKSVEKGADSVADDMEGWGEGAKKAVAAVDAQLAKLEGKLDPKNKHTLRNLYMDWFETPILKEIISFIEKSELPGPVKSTLVGTLKYMDEELKSDMMEFFGKLWNDATSKAIEAVQAVVGKLRGESNLDAKRKQGGGDSIIDWAQRKLGGVGDLYGPDGRPDPSKQIAPDRFSPPSHTEVAKDHDDIEGKVKDSERALEEIDDEIRKGVREKADEHGHDHSHGGGDDGHGHKHEAGWAGPVASKLGGMASKRVGEKVNKAWNLPPASPESEWKAVLAEIDAEIDYLMAHPEDTREFWEQPIRAALAEPRLGAKVRELVGKCALDHKGH